MCPAAQIWSHGPAQSLRIEGYDLNRANYSNLSHDIVQQVGFAYAHNINYKHVSGGIISV